jgi:hypothetical protein
LNKKLFPCFSKPKQRGEIIMEIIRNSGALAPWRLSVLFLLATAVIAKAGDYTYTTNSDNTLTITQYTGSGGEVVVPSVIDGRIVTIIGAGAFGTSSWRNPNTSLTSATIPDSVTSIGDGAFQNCISLTNVMIGNGVTNIGDDVFYNCWSLTSIAVDEGNYVYSSVDGVLFNKNQIRLFKYPAGKIGSSYTIPTGVTSIGDYAFSDCTNLTSVAIPSGVTNIGNYAFYNCRLTSVTIPDSVTIIGDGAFEQCNHLASIMIGKDVINIGDYAFEYCSSLTSVTIPDSVISIGNLAFAHCYDLTSAIIGKGVISIGNYAFIGCFSLINVAIGNGVTSIGDWVFFDCANLMGIYFSGNAPGIGTGVFDYDDNATVYYLPGTTGWGTTFGGRPAMQWWDGPQISANGTREDVAINRDDTLRIAVAMDADNHVGFPVDWWVLAHAGSDWYYLNNSGQWTQFNGSSLNCHPVYQGGLFNLPPLEVLNARGLQPGSYTFWFGVDYPMDGILNLGGYILLDAVNVTVQ